MSQDTQGRKARPRMAGKRVSPAELGRLVEKAKAGDVEAFRGLYDVFAERILNYVYRLTGSREDAEDLTQDTFILAFRKLDSLKDNRKIQSWLYRIAQNNVFQRYRSKGPQSDSLDEDEAMEMSENQAKDVPAKNPEEAVLASELEDVVDRVIQRLPPKYRQVFVLAAVQNLSYQEISEIVGRSLASVKSDIHRARVSVRDQIKEYLGENYGMSTSL